MARKVGLYLRAAKWYIIELFVRSRSPFTNGGFGVKPILQAILLADHIYQDMSTGKIIVAGTFDRMMVRENKQDKGGEEPNKAIPMTDAQRAGTPFAYINLRGIHGKATFILRYVYLDTGEVQFETSPITVQVSDPLRSAEIIAPLPELPRQPGGYALELHSGDEMLGSHRVQVEKHE